MQMDSPEFLRKLCATKLIRPFSYYVERSPWKLRKANVEEAFLDKMGLYCFWWSGPPQVFLDRIAQYRYDGENYPSSSELALEHELIPAYVGRTAMAAKRNGSTIKGRLIDHLVRFPSLMKQWLTAEAESRLVRRLSGICDNFQLFDYPERIRARIASMVNEPSMSLSAAQDYLIGHQSQCHELIVEFQENYWSLMYDNFSISFVPFTNESESFFAEALSIGLLRPPLNHS